MTESEDSLSTAPSSPNSTISSSTVSSTQSSMLRSQVNKALIPIKRLTTLAHPSTAVMVTAAIKSLNDKKGSTLQGIKKFITINYQVDTAKSAPFIRKYLKSAVAKGQLIQTNGTGATGNFKLPVEVKKPAVKKKLDVVATSKKKKKPEVKKLTAKKAAPTVTSGKRRAIEEEEKTTATVSSNAKKPKKVATAEGKPKAKKVVEVVVPKTAPPKTKKEAPATKTNSTKVAAKKVPVKKVTSKKK